jgi:hypothetical protein
MLVLVTSVRTSDTAVCLTSDLVDSRSLEHRADVQLQLEAMLADVNREFADALLVPFTITLGDEWQGLLRNSASALRADFAIRETLRPLSIASGFGVGPFETALRERTALMDGTCFHRSRTALENARRRKGSAAILQSDDTLLDEPVNAVLLLLHAISEGWTEKQAASFQAFDTHGTESAAAKVLGVSQPTVHQSLEGSMAKMYVEARDGLLRFVDSYERGRSVGL